MDLLPFAFFLPFALRKVWSVRIGYRAFYGFGRLTAKQMSLVLRMVFINV